MAFVVNGLQYFLSHRLVIANRLLEQGYTVHIVAPDDCPENFNQYGFIYHQVKISRKSVNPFVEFMVIRRLAALFKAIRPDLVHLVTIKPYLYGGIAARIARVPGVVSAVAGLGIVFSQNNSKTWLLRVLLYPLFRLAFGHKNQHVIFQNGNDEQVLQNWLTLSEQEITVIRGAGVELSSYSYVAELEGDVPVVVLAARLLKDKGVEQFVEASRLLQSRNVGAKFWLVGKPDQGNSNSVTPEQLKAWENEALVECLGYRSDIPVVFSQANIVCLPSFYGEGLPKVLLEAAACGRVVVTTDWPGCRDAITPNETGLLVPVRDAVALADALEKLIIDPECRRQMGRAGRALAKDVCTIVQVGEEHMDIYEDLLIQADG